MRRRLHCIRRTPTILLLPVFAGWLATTLGCGAEAHPPRIERIFLVTIDTLRADHLGFMGYPRETSPFLDSLAQSGLVFSSAYSSASTTAPSHSTLFTGLEPPQHRLLANGRNLKEVLLTLPEVLHDNGYQTAAFTPTGFLDSLNQGYDEFWSSEEYVPATEVLEAAAAWIEEQDPEQPLFVWIHLFDIHEWKKDERLHPEGYEWATRDRVDQGKALAEYLLAEQRLDVRSQIGKRSVGEVIDRYDGQIRVVDAELGRFFRRMDAAGWADKSLWVVTADHGEGIGNHDFLFHGELLYQEQLHVPLILVFPDTDRLSGVVGSRVRLVDLGPTLAALASADFDNQVMPLTGRSFARSLVLGGGKWQEPDVFALRRPANKSRLELGWVPGDVYSLRRASWKVLVKTEADLELYDLSEDPFELEDLATSEADLAGQLAGAATRKYQELWEDGRVVGTGEVDTRYEEELRALGYL